MIDFGYIFKLQKEIPTKTAQLYKNGCDLQKSWVKSCEIKDGGHEMAAMIINGFVH